MVLFYTYMGFEKRVSVIESTMERGIPLEKHPLLTLVHSKVEAVRQEGAINPKDFISLYGEQNVARDLSTVERLKSKFESDEYKIAAETLEAIMLEHTELSDWLGPNAETIKTTEFDDIVNGVDMVLEFNENNSTQRLALGIDVTFGVNNMRKKFDRIRDEIHADELAQVKYFKAHGYQGSLRQLPRLIVGVEMERIINLAGLWDRKENKALADHITKDILVDELERQLRTFLIYAQSVHAPNAARSYTQALATLKNVRTVKNGFAEDRSRKDLIVQDRVHQEIMRNLERFR